MNLEPPFPHAEERRIPFEGGVAEGRLFLIAERRPFFHAPGARKTNGPPRFPWRAYLLTVPSQATVKSLSSPRDPRI